MRLTPTELSQRIQRFRKRYPNGVLPWCRVRVVHQLARALDYGLDRELDCTPQRRYEIAAELERGCFNATVRQCRLDQRSTAWGVPWMDFRTSYFGQLYGVYTRDVLGQLAGADVPGELQRMACARVSVMSDSELRAVASAPLLVPEVNRATEEELRERHRLNAAEQEVRGSELYQCSCGARNVEIRMKQTRAADEGATVLVRCLECGNKFRG